MCKFKRFLLGSFLGLCVVSFGQAAHATKGGNHTISFTVSSGSKGLGAATFFNELEGDDHINGSVTIGDNGDSISSSATLTSAGGSNISTATYAYDDCKKDFWDIVFEDNYNGKSTFSQASVWNANSATINASSSKKDDVYSSSASGSFKSDDGGSMDIDTFAGDRNEYEDKRTQTHIIIDNANTASASASSSKKDDVYSSSASGSFKSDDGGRMDIDTFAYENIVSRNRYEDKRTQTDISIDNANTASASASSSKKDDVYSSSASGSFKSDDGGSIGGRTYSTYNNMYKNSSFRSSFRIVNAYNLKSASFNMSSSAQNGKANSNAQVNFANNEYESYIMVVSDSFYKNSRSHSYIVVRNLNSASFNMNSSVQDSKFTSRAKVNKAIGDTNDDNEVKAQSYYSEKEQDINAEYASTSIYIDNLNYSYIDTYSNSSQHHSILNASGEAKKIYVYSFAHESSDRSYGTGCTACKFTSKANVTQNFPKTFIDSKCMHVTHWYIKK